ncbi:MAG: DUF2231 domain-containing protein [Candidatus Methanofastidiosia archaeon]
MLKIFKEPVHPISIHFSSALLPTTLFFYLLFLLTSEVSFERASYYTLILGFLGIFPAFFSGYLDWKSRFKGYMSFIFKVKLYGSILLLLTSFVTLVARTAYENFVLSNIGTLAYLGLLITNTLLMVIVGHYGGRLVHS